MRGHGRFSQGGGVGLALANWMTEGDPGFDVWGMDVSRFGGWATPAYTTRRSARTIPRFRIRFPNEELPEGRPCGPYRYTTGWWRPMPCSASLTVSNPLWYAPKGAPATETVSYHRSNAFGSVAEECRAVREGVGMMEASGYGRFLVEGRCKGLPRPGHGECPPRKAGWR